MRILLDECVPRPLRRELPDHEVHTVVEMGWAGKQNGELLRRLTAEHFAVFLTTDQNLRYQQNFRGLQVAVVVLIAPTQQAGRPPPTDADGPHGARDHSAEEQKQYIRKRLSGKPTQACPAASSSQPTALNRA